MELGVPLQIRDHSHGWGREGEDGAEKKGEMGYRGAGEFEHLYFLTLCTLLLQERNPPIDDF